MVLAKRKKRKYDVIYELKIIIINRGHEFYACVVKVLVLYLRVSACICVYFDDL